MRKKRRRIISSKINVCEALTLLCVSTLGGILLGMYMRHPNFLNCIFFNKCDTNIIPPENCPQTNANFNKHDNTLSNAYTRTVVRDDDIEYKKYRIRSQFAAQVKSNSGRKPMPDKILMGPGQNGTRWAGVIAADGPTFWKRWLHQYPSDMVSDRPALIFSHENAIKHGSKKLWKTCKIMDVAIIPDVPGVCAAITETMQDNQAYHPLTSTVVKSSANDHNRYTVRSDGSVMFIPEHHLGDGGDSLGARGRAKPLPQTDDYSCAREALKMFFEKSDVMKDALSLIPVQNQTHPDYRRTQWVGCVVEDESDLELLRNSVMSTIKIGVHPTKFWVFTTNPSLKVKMDTIHLGKNIPQGIQSVVLTGLELNEIGNTVCKKSRNFKTHFMQIWLAFTASDLGIRFLWQSPATVWLERPDRIVNVAPNVEIISIFKGREKGKMDPFRPSFDFLIAGTEPRAQHLLHEILMHVELISTWKSLEDVLAYRLTENNSRYGLSVSVLPPEVATHSDFVQLKDVSGENITNYIKSLAPQKPSVIVLPRHVGQRRAKAILSYLNLWFL
jgi:hypothetical protein